MQPSLRVLNRLAVLHYRSPFVYLHFARPWSNGQSSRAIEVLDQIAVDHQAMYDRIGALLTENNVPVEAGEFPIRFTALHDLSIDYLIPRLLDQQQRLSDEIQKSLDQLDSVPLARALAEEALGEAQAHADMLRELDASPVTT